MDMTRIAIALVFCLIQPDGMNGEDYSDGNACIFDVNQHLPKKNEPLFLQRTSGSLNLLLPKMRGNSGAIVLKKQEKIIISCPGRRNYIAEFKKEMSEGSCLGGTKLNINGSGSSLSDLGCSSRVAATTKPTGRNCAKGKGISVEMGFNFEGDWIPLVESCHDVENSHTYYSRHVIYGDVIAGKVKRKTDSPRPSFCNGDSMFFKGFDPMKSYTKKNQISVFMDKLGKDSAAKYLDQRNSFLAKGHLAPDADFIFSAHQFSTYFFINASPQWQSINCGNWFKLEDNTRKIAKNLGVNLEVVTGTEGVLRLEGKDVRQEVRLQDTRLPVPQHFWKVLRNPRDSSCIAFVSTNNPFLKEKPQTICQDICQRYNWPLLQDNLSKGYVYCCDYQSLMNAVPEMPQLSCKSVLRGIF